MGYPDPQHPGEHPGGQNYPASPGGAPKPTRAYERDEFGAPQGPPPVPPQGQYPGPDGPQGPPTQYDGGYRLGYAQGAYGDQYGAGPQPPQGLPGCRWPGRPRRWGRRLRRWQ
ncbi:hypothetical protein [Tsukamurella sp. PLM1]|uniref:hypothetical protein n=1 Tax=Tsukamurella sp. PLM1 TaxID=2929795 RepID=UPI002050997E|nr:hypothetical protein [Tsukamurella sp. PLM1]BDH55064.1 hypothetical protein MTP03_00030 [Tsukamurella sp. PLM1]